MNPFGWSGLLTGISSSALGILVWNKSPNRRLGWIWLLFAHSVALWGFGIVGFTLSVSPIVSLWIWRFAGIFSVVTMPALFFHFVCIFCEIRRKKLLILHYVVMSAFLVFSPTRLFVENVRWAFDSFYWSTIGSWYPGYALWWFLSILYSHIELLRSYHLSSEHKKNQIKYFFCATAIGFSGGSLCFLPMFRIDVYPWGNFTVPIFCGIMSYAILKHQLLDIQVLIRKTVVYSLVSGILAAIMIFLGVVVAHFNEGHMDFRTIYPAGGAALVIAVIFHPLQRKVQATVDRYLFKGWADRETVREVAAGFSHELKSPLAGLSLRAEMTLSDLEELEKGEKSLREVLPKIKEELRYIMNQAMDAARRIEAVRGVAEPAGGTLVAVSVPEVLASSLVILGPLVARVGAEVSKSIPGDLALVRSDPKQLEIVFINLMKNALEAMEEEPLERSRRLLLGAKVEGGSVLVTVGDTGPGIPPKDVGRLFEPYHTTKGRKGTGMGLYLSQQIVKAHGGLMEVKSEEGKGTEFIVRLPTFSKENRTGTHVA